MPVIIDAGIGRPSQACDAMEMGADAVMAYTAVASAGNIPLMAEAFKHAIDAGRAAYLSGLGKVTRDRLCRPADYGVFALTLLLAPLSEGSQERPTQYASQSRDWRRLAQSCQSWFIIVNLTGWVWL